MIDETYTMSVEESALHPEYAVTQDMAKKTERESQNAVNGVKWDTDGNMIL